MFDDWKISDMIKISDYTEISDQIEVFDVIEISSSSEIIGIESGNILILLDSIFSWNLYFWVESWN